MRILVVCQAKTIQNSLGTTIVEAGNHMCNDHDLCFGEYEKVTSESEREILHHNRP
jgi:hypothetical protein